MHCMDSLLSEEKQMDDLILSLGVVEVDKQTPVNEPGPLLKLCQMKHIWLEKQRVIKIINTLILQKN